MEERLIDGRRILKHGADGAARFVEQQEHRVAFTKPDGSKGDRVRYEDVPIFDEAAQREKFRRTRFGMDFSLVSREREATVHDELASLPPLLAAKLQATLKLGPAPAVEAHPAGTLYASKRALQMFGGGAIEEAVERHCAGDVVDELTDDQRWCPHLFGQGVVNVVAARTGQGVAQSQHVLSMTGDPRERRSLSIATLHEDGERTTLCWFSDDPAGPGGRI